MRSLLVALLLLVAVSRATAQPAPDLPVKGPVARQDRDVEGVTFVDVEGDSDIETG